MRSRFEGLTSYGRPVPPKVEGRYSPGAWVKGYETLHAERRAELEGIAKALREQAAAIDERCAEERAKAS